MSETLFLVGHIQQHHIFKEVSKVWSNALLFLISKNKKNPVKELDFTSLIPAGVAIVLNEKQLTSLDQKDEAHDWVKEWRKGVETMRKITKITKSKITNE